MQPILDAIRDVLGVPADWYTQLNPSSNQYTWNYAPMFEYFFAGVILCIVVAAVFRFLVNLVK